ncbi:MAG: hypothetical protein QMD09_15130 [Desulfatibacillaceae bacterium]|nr:hypothetical protein [Desulfatibacillaceae bacterium]
MNSESAYNLEQRQTWEMIAQLLQGQQGESLSLEIAGLIKPYLDFRKELAQFQESKFKDFCTAACFDDNTSACCSREGIVTFFADALVNAVASTPKQIQTLLNALDKPREDGRCVYLSDTGCLWQIPPVVCALFVCDRLEREVLAPNSDWRKTWQAFAEKRKSFTWPDRPVLFDSLEKLFIEKGFDSPLMYLNKSPGLLKIKAKAGLL